MKNKESAQTSISNPFRDAEGTGVKVQCWLSSDVHTYLVRGVIAGTYGAVNAILATLVLKLHDELKRRNVPGHWEPGNESAIASVLADLNFDPFVRRSAIGRKAAPGKRARAGRADNPPSVPPTQPAGRGHVAAATVGTDPTTQTPLNLPSSSNLPTAQ